MIGFTLDPVTLSLLKTSFHNRCLLLSLGFLFYSYSAQLYFGYIFASILIYRVRQTTRARCRVSVQIKHFNQMHRHYFTSRKYFSFNGEVEKGQDYKFSFVKKSCLIQKALCTLKSIVKIVFNDKFQHAYALNVVGQHKKI